MTPSTHAECIAHSGMIARLNVTVAISAIGMLIAGAVLTVAVEIKSALDVTAAEQYQAHEERENMRDRLSDIERMAWTHLAE